MVILNIKYEGDYANAEREGHGKYVYENGDYYIGEWKNDNPNVEGILYKKMAMLNISENLLKAILKDTVICL